MHCVIKFYAGLSKKFLSFRFLYAFFFADYFITSSVKNVSDYTVFIIVNCGFVRVKFFYAKIYINTFIVMPIITKMAICDECFYLTRITGSIMRVPIFRKFYFIGFSVVY